MIKKFVFVLLFLFIGVSSVDAMMGNKTFGISVRMNENKESNNIDDEELSMCDGKLIAKGDSFSISDLKVDYIDLENVENAINNVNVVISGDNVVDALGTSFWSGTITISGEGSLKFKPAVGYMNDGKRIVPYMIQAGMNSAYLDKEEDQKAWVSEHLITDIPVTYKDGYVYLNYEEPEKHVEEPLVIDNIEEETGNYDNLIFLVILLSCGVLGVSIMVIFNKNK